MREMIRKRAAASEQEADAEAVASLREAISRKGTSFRATIFDEDGHTIPHTEFSGDKAIRTVCLTFHNDGEEFTTTAWSPRSCRDMRVLRRPWLRAQCPENIGVS
mgnify:CR=1 FL=1